MSSTPLSLASLYREYTGLFREHGFDSPEVEAAYLIADVSGVSHTLVPFSDSIPDPDVLRCAEDRLRRRLAGEPYQYICGWAAFRELRLSVGPGCLIPRPETELLVDRILSVLPRGGRFCEWGTGSGAIALSLAFERPDADVSASELSPDAFAWAEKNRTDLQLSRVRLRQGDLGSPFKGERFDVIAANLPYISPDEKASLPVNVRDWEPPEALFADRNGLALLDRAVREAPDSLTPGGWLLLEIGETQGAHLLETAKPWRHAEIAKDQYGADRFFIGTV